MRKKAKFYLTLIGLTALFCNAINAQKWEKKQAPIMTTWSESIDTSNVLNEYPRPQKVRNEWINLNGVWDLKKKNTYMIGTYAATETYNQRILVPFPVESALSGIMDSDYNNQSKSYIYRRFFTIPESMAGKEMLLNFGAVDWQCVVFINGVNVGKHEGGFDPFTFNITSALKASGNQEIVVQVFDPTDGGQLHGKQALIPGFIDYAPSSGIWQTVWLEPVSKVHITDFIITPDVDHKSVKIKVLAEATDAASKVDVSILDHGVEVEKATIGVGTETSILMTNPRLWSPETPHLYTLKFTLKNGETVVDQVDSYFGMRKIALGKLRGKPFMYLNDQPVFQYGPLDQGFWPDGLFTAPSYDALKSDLLKTKELGCNMTRKHLKIEPARWYYYCDSIGLMVWQDIPNSTNTDTNKENILGDAVWIKQNYLRETENIVKALQNYPSIILWVPFNEGWGQYGTDASHTRSGVNLIKSLDTTRLVDAASGWTDYECGDICDAHSYPKPELLLNPYNKRANVCGETSGYGFRVENHTYSNNSFSYVIVPTAESLTTMLEEVNQVALGLTVRGLNALVLTQLTDVEKEINGLYTYDRKVFKLDELQKARFMAGIETLKTKSIGGYIYPTAIQSDTIKWKYKTTSVVPSGWNTDTNFDDSGWSTGFSGFGNLEPPNSISRTVWNTPTIYLRKKINFSKLTDEEFNGMVMNIYNDEDYEVYINGVLAASASGYVTDYKVVMISNAAKAALKRNGDNLIAVKCRQTVGGQYIDLGFSTLTSLDNDPKVVVVPATFKEISTPEQFNDIRKDLSGFYRLTSDIDLSGFLNFEPIGSNDKPFTGCIDGGKHKISNLKISNLTGGFQGLFGFAYGAYFMDMELDKPIVKGNYYVGTLFGMGAQTTVERVAITQPTVSGAVMVGGLGGATADILLSQIKDSYVANGTISASTYIVGGLLGYAQSTLINHAYFSGKISGVKQGLCYAGGLVGYSGSSVLDVKGAVSLATSINGGTNNQFVSGGYPMREATDIYTYPEMTLAADVDLNYVQWARAAQNQIKNLSVFKTQSFYEEMGWDFEKVWLMPESTYPVLKYATIVGIGKNAVDQNTLKAYAQDGRVTIESASPAAIWIYTLDGTLVKRFDVEENLATVTLSKGFYIVRSISGGHTQSLKIWNN